MPDDTNGRNRPVPAELVDYELDADAEGLDEADIVQVSDEALTAVEVAAERAARESRLRTELDATRAELKAAKTELESLRDMYLRKLAEFDNFRKRTEREREERERTAGELVVRELVPVLDNFARALQHGGDGDAAAFRLGVEMIAKQLRESLQRQGLEIMDPLGEPFNPEHHDAVQRVERAGTAAGTVVDVLGYGYIFGGRLLRPALVAVAVSAADDDGEGECSP